MLTDNERASARKAKTKQNLDDFLEAFRKMRDAAKVANLDGPFSIGMSFRDAAVLGAHSRPEMTRTHIRPDGTVTLYGVPVSINR